MGNKFRVIKNFIKVFVKAGFCWMITSRINNYKEVVIYNKNGQFAGKEVCRIKVAV